MLIACAETDRSAGQGWVIGQMVVESRYNGLPMILLYTGVSRLFIEIPMPAYLFHGRDPIPGLPSLNRQTRSFHYLDHGGIMGANNGTPAGHRLQLGKTQSFVQGRGDKEGRIAVQSDQLFIIHITHEMDIPRREI